MNELNRLESVLFEKIWGGTKLKKFKQSDLPNIGESWEVSTHIGGNSRLKGKKLGELTQLDYLIKFIDTDEDLSIQVHPDDSYAKKFEKDNGKPECWFILEAVDGAGIYLGFKNGITKEKFENAVQNKEKIDNYLNFIPVSRGMFVTLPPGAVHAIGKGVTLCEVQKASDITYRVWDWNRVDQNGISRELHLDRAFEVMRFDENFNQQLVSNIVKNAFDDASSFKLDDKIKMDIIRDKESVTLLANDSLIDLDNLQSYFSLVRDNFKILKNNIYLKVSQLK